MTDNGEVVKPPINPRDFFSSAKNMGRFTEDVYDKTIQVLWSGFKLESFPGKIRRWPLERSTLYKSAACSYINDVAFRELGSLGLPAELLRYGGIQMHEFVNIRGDNTPEEPSYLVDLSFKQFIRDESQQEALPHYMVIPYTTREDVIEGLIRHHIPPEKHYYYLNAIFEPDLPGSRRKTLPPRRT